MNRSETRRYILQIIKDERPGWEVSSVDAQTYAYLENKLKGLIKDLTWRHPSKGKTFKVQNVAIGR